MGLLIPRCRHIFFVNICILQTVKILTYFSLACIGRSNEILELLSSPGDAYEEKTDGERGGDVLVEGVLGTRCLGSKLTVTVIWISRLRESFHHWNHMELPAFR